MQARQLTNTLAGYDKGGGGPKDHQGLADEATVCHVV